MFLERFDKTYKNHFESFRFLLIGYSKTKSRSKFWTENIVHIYGVYFLFWCFVGDQTQTFTRPLWITQPVMFTSQKLLKH